MAKLQNGKMKKPGTGVVTASVSGEQAGVGDASAEMYLGGTCDGA
jgi:hypothetical protein